VLSPSTESIDRDKKLIYAREGVTHAWLVDPLRQALEVLALEASNFVQIDEHHGEASGAPV
jgi:Uma2 family endonuclease